MLAADTDPLEILLHLPLLCEDKVGVVGVFPVSPPCEGAPWWCSCRRFVGVVGLASQCFSVCLCHSC